MRTPILVCALFALFFLSSVENVWACSCVPEDRNSSLNQKVRDAYRDSAAVFAGEIIGINKPPNSMVAFITIRVVDAWKGNIPPTITIVTNIGSQSCEFPFAPEQLYLIYAIPDGNMLSTNICSRTNFLPNNPDVAILNKITKRTP